MNDSTHVAVKVVPALYGKRAIRRFETEMAALCSLPYHPHLLRHYSHVMLDATGDDTGDDHVGVICELLPSSSQSLQSRLYRSRATPLDEAAKHRVLLDLLEALVVLHAHGITHRDLSPAHVLLLPDSHAIKLIDYGLPTLKNTAANRSNTDNTSLGVSLAYASPEVACGQLLCHDVDGWKRSDVFSFTVLLVEVLLDEPPYEGELPLTIRKAIEACEPRPFAVENLRLNGVMSSALERTVSRAWHVDPRERPTAAGLLEALQNVFRV